MNLKVTRRGSDETLARLSPRAERASRSLAQIDPQLKLLLKLRQFIIA